MSDTGGRGGGRSGPVWVRTRTRVAMMVVMSGDDDLELCCSSVGWL